MDEGLLLLERLLVDDRGLGLGDVLLDLGERVLCLAGSPDRQSGGERESGHATEGQDRRGVPVEEQLA
jgi:hypothetical protein